MSILNQIKELFSKLDDSTRKISSLEEPISVATQCDTEEVKRGKTLFGYKGSRSYNSYRNFEKSEEHCDSLS